MENNSICREYSNDVVAYIVYKLGCIHPFTLSRVLALVEMKWFEEHGEWPTSFTYKGFLKVFYVDGLKEFIEQNQCYKRVEKENHGCIMYVCKEPFLPSNIRDLIDNVINEIKDLSIEELNNVAVNNHLYSSLLKKKC